MTVEFILFTQLTAIDLRLTSDILKLDWPYVEERIERFIKDYVRRSGAFGVVLGLSGGVDSSTAAALSSIAIGGDKVLGLILPEGETYDPADVQNAKLVADRFGFRAEVIDITPVLNAFYKALPIFDSSDKISKGNVKVRTRAACIYYYANKLNMIVCGSSDKSEVMLGYFTKWGDIAADIAPLMDLYKTQVRQLALHIGVPPEVALRPSTPALWPGQTAKEELGLDYDVLDLILYGLERFMRVDEIAEQLGLSVEVVESVKRRWLTREHKRRMPLTVKLEYRTIGADFRLPYTLP